MVEFEAIIPFFYDFLIKTPSFEEKIMGMFAMIL